MVYVHDNDTPVGAGGAVSTDPSKVTEVGDSLYFNHFQRSDTLNNLKGVEGTRIVLPETMHNDPQYGHIVHFDIFYKKTPKMEDAQRNIEQLFGFDTIKESIQNQGGDLSNMVGDFISNGSANEQQDQLLDAISMATGVNADEPALSAGAVEEDTRLGRAVEHSLDKVTLYMPRGLKNSDSLNYSEVDYGLIKSAMEGNLAALIPGMAKKLAGFVDGLAEITATELNTAEAVTSITGAVRNPRKEQLFQGVGFRSFDFTFNIFPKSRKESHDLMEMVKLFRFHAHPEIAPGQAFYTFPSEFQITFVDLTYPTNNPFQFLTGPSDGVIAKENAWINKIGRCALTNVGVDYFPLDSMSTFPDGAPTSVALTLTFTEMETMSRGHIKEGF